MIPSPQPHPVNCRFQKVKCDYFGYPCECRDESTGEGICKFDICHYEREKVMDELEKIRKYIPSPLTSPNDCEALQYIHVMNCNEFHKHMDKLLADLRQQEKKE